MNELFEVSSPLANETFRLVGLSLTGVCQCAADSITASLPHVKVHCRVMLTPYGSKPMNLDPTKPHPMVSRNFDSATAGLNIVYQVTRKSFGKPQTFF